MRKKLSRESGEKVKKKTEPKELCICDELKGSIQTHMTKKNTQPK